MGVFEDKLLGRFERKLGFLPDSTFNTEKQCLFPGYKPLFNVAMPISSEDCVMGKLDRYGNLQILDRDIQLNALVQVLNNYISNQTK